MPSTGAALSLCHVLFQRAVTLTSHGPRKRPSGVTARLRWKKAVSKPHGVKAKADNATSHRCCAHNATGRAGPIASQAGGSPHASYRAATNKVAVVSLGLKEIEHAADIFM